MFFPTLIVSMFLTIALIPVLKLGAVRLRAVDLPNPRKVHTRPIPKVGGIAMAVGVLIPLLVWAPKDRTVQGILMGLGVIFGFGLLDDIKDLGYRAKFTGQFLAAGLVIFWGGLEIQWLGDMLPDGTCLPSAVSIPLTLMAIVGVTNAVNLADGLDGLAGGIMLMAFICIGYMAYLTGEGFIMLASAAVIGATFGFLRFNTHPATVFMGDTGSQMIGFMGISLCLALTQPQNAVSPLFPLLLLGLPVLDTLAVMTERIAAGLSPFRADKRHLHHKLMALGLYHREAVFALYVLQAVMIVLAYILRFHSEWSILLTYLLLSGGLVALVRVAIQQRWKIPRRDLIDAAVKGPLRRWRERQVLIRIAYKGLFWGAPLLLSASVLMPATVPWYLALLAGVFAGGLLAPAGEPRWSGGVLRTGIYLLTPTIICLAVSEPSAWWTPAFSGMRHVAFALLLIASFMTLRFTRRRRGFKVTPTDFLVIFVALAFPLLFKAEAVSPHYGTITAEVMILLYAYEVIIGECRGRLRTVSRLTAAGLAVLVLKALI